MSCNKVRLIFQIFASKIKVCDNNLILCFALVCQDIALKKGGGFYDTLGSEVPKIAFSQLWPQLLMDRADFWHGDSFLVELHLKLAIFPFRLSPLPPAPP